jgi:hypothetical protein
MHSIEINLNEPGTLLTVIAASIVLWFIISVQIIRFAVGQRLQVIEQQLHLNNQLLRLQIKQAGLTDKEIDLALYSKQRALKALEEEFRTNKITYEVYLENKNSILDGE